MHESIEASLRRLGIDAIDVLQIHNATEAVLLDEPILRALADAVSAGKIRFAGASVYRVDEALLAMQQPMLRTVQAPFNLLDQEMRRQVFARAEEAGVGVLVRSAFLRGVLTDDAGDLPSPLLPLRAAALRAQQTAGIEVSGIAELALRFCLSVPAVSCVLVGVRSVEELENNVAAAARGPFDADTTGKLYGCPLRDEPLLNPLNWTGFI